MSEKIESRLSTPHPYGDYDTLLQSAREADAVLAETLRRDPKDPRIQDLTDDRDYYLYLLQHMREATNPDARQKQPS